MSKISVFMKDVEVPEIVQEKAEAAFSRIKTEGEINMSKAEKTRKNKRIVKPMITAAACAVLLMAAGFMNWHMDNGEQTADKSDMARTPDISAETARIKDFIPDFSITAYAEEPDAVPAEEGEIIFADMGYGEGGYTGMLFNIRGDDISGVHLSLNKGELYSATFENSTEDALTDWLAQGAPDEDNNPDTHTIIVPSPAGEEGDTESPRNVMLYHCIKKGNAVSEGYDSEIYYGFYIPDDTLVSADDRGDMAADYHRMLSVFEGSVLKVTVTYTNGSSLTKEYDLTVAKLAQDESGTVTDREWTGGGEGAFVYGILAKEKI